MDYVRRASGAAAPALWRVSFLGGTPKKLLENIATPIGTGFLYAAGTPQNLWVESLDGTPARQLTHFTDDRQIADAAWSRDGTRLAIARTTTATDIVLFRGLEAGIAPRPEPERILVGRVRLSHVRRRVTQREGTRGPGPLADSRQPPNATW